MSYESHITFDRDIADQVREFAVEIGWKFSQIDGDPVLGDKVFCYLSQHDLDQEKLTIDMEKAVKTARSRGLKPIRQKIEKIIFDQRW